MQNMLVKKYSGSLKKHTHTTKQIRHHIYSREQREL